MCIFCGNLLLLGKNILKYNPLFTVKCVSFVGTDIASKEFRDKMTDTELETNLSGQYAAVMAFISRNLRNIQVEVGFNSLGRLEIPYDVFVELLVNAFVHRDYFQNAPIRLFIFDDRVEIISPGGLPDDMTEEMIRKGVSKPRNPLLFDYAKYLLPYTGIGSGILRALKEYSFISFENSYQKGELTLAGLLLLGKNILKYNPLFTVKCVSFVGKNTLEEKILAEIRRDRYVTQKQLAERLQIGFYTVKEYMTKLKKKERIKRVGSDRSGYWEVIK